MLQLPWIQVRANGKISRVVKHLIAKKTGSQREPAKKFAVNKFKRTFVRTTLPPVFFTYKLSNSAFVTDHLPFESFSASTQPYLPSARLPGFIMVEFPIFEMPALSCM